MPIRTGAFSAGAGGGVLASLMLGAQAGTAAFVEGDVGGRPGRRLLVKWDVHG